MRRIPDRPIQTFERFGSRVKRALTAPLRALPDFIILGAQKAGTTSLYEHLRTHPAFVPPLHKEIHYFDLHFSQPLLWYRAHFPTRSMLGGAEHFVTGEASPDYLYHPETAERIRETLSDPKLIVLLRDPVERAFSHYHHERERNREPLASFEEAVRAERDRLHTSSFTTPGGADGYTSEHRRHSYLARGRYAEQLRRYFERFPRDRVLVLFSESMFADPQTTLDRVLDFLELAPMSLPDLGARNVGAYDKDRSIPMAAELRRIFEAPDRELSELLGVPLPWPSVPGGRRPSPSRDTQSPTFTAVEPTLP